MTQSRQQSPEHEQKCPHVELTRAEVPESLSVQLEEVESFRQGGKGYWERRKWGELEGEREYEKSGEVPKREEKGWGRGWEQEGWRRGWEQEGL